MRLKELNLTSFGVFNDYKLSFSEDKGFHIIFGENEAGKSTILRSIIALLYGIPHRSNDDFRHDKILVKGTITGSSYEGEKGKKQELTFTRRKGNKNTIIDDDNNPIREEALDSFLNNIDKEAFTNMFGLDHMRLREGGHNILKGGGQVGETLFETAAGLSHIREISKELEREASDLYKKSGSKPVLNNNLKLFREEKRKIKEDSLSSGNWKELEESYDRSKKETDAISEDIKILRAKISYYEKIKRILPLAGERQDSLRRLEELGNVPDLREDFRKERQKITDLLDKKTDEKKKLEIEIEELRERIKKINIPDELINESVLISELHEKLDAYRNVVKDLPHKIEEHHILQEKAESLLKEINPAMNELVQAEQLMLSHETKEEINRLCEENTVLGRDKAIIEERVRSMEISLKKKEAEQKKIGKYKDFEPLKSLLDKVSNEGDLEELLRKNIAKRDLLKRKIDEKISSMGLWNGSADEINLIPVVLPETVALFEEKFEVIKEKISDNGKEKNRCRETLEKLKKDLAENEAGGTVPSESDLTEKRIKRDNGWKLIKKSWLLGLNDPQAEDEFKGETSLDIAYEKSVFDADNISDIRYNEAEVAARKENLLQNITVEKERLKKLSEEEGLLDKEYADIKAAWADAWKESGIEPLSPREMHSWLQRFREIRDQVNTLAELDSEISQVREKIDRFFNHINIELNKLNGENILPENDNGKIRDSINNEEMILKGPEKVAFFTRILNEARQRVEKLEKLAFNFKSNKEEIEKINNDLASIREDEERHRAKEGAWKEQWEKAMKNLNLSPESHCSVALSYLKKNEELFTHLNKLKDLQFRLENMKKYQKEFEDKADEILKKTADDLSESPYHLAVSELIKRYERASKELAASEENKDRKNKLKISYDTVCKEINELQQKLEQLMSEASCSDLTELVVIEEKHKEGENLKQEIKRLEKMITRESEGMSLDEIINEISLIDGDNLLAEISEYQHEISLKEQERKQLEQKFGVIKNNYEETIKGSEEKALLAAEKAQSILADIAEQAEQFITLKLGALILNRGIDNYRQKNQDPILKKASEIFQRLTLSSFSGLTVEYDEKDEAVLVGLRKGGETVGIEGMSDGTQDQLYLALRLAFIEKYCEETAPMPLILDDILINFDDNRSGVTLKILGELSQKTQIIFFTHHGKLLTLAGDNVNEKSLQVHRISNI